MAKSSQCRVAPSINHNIIFSCDNHLFVALSIEVFLANLRVLNFRSKATSASETNNHYSKYHDKNDQPFSFGGV